MGFGQGGDPGREGAVELFDAGGRPRGGSDERLDGRQGVAHPMMKFPHQQGLALLGAATGGESLIALRDRAA